MRDAFINRVMADTPSVDINAIQEKAHDLVVKDALSQSPPDVRKLWKNGETRPWVSRVSYWFNRNNHGYNFSSLMIPSIGAYRMSDATRQEVDQLAAEAEAAAKLRATLETRLRSVAYSCSTRKALAAALPEFEKYLPEDNPAAVRSLPVVANVVADFVRAGWPKDKQVAA